MAAMIAREIMAKRPEHIDTAKTVFRYDAPSDALSVHLNGLGQPGVSVPVSEHEYIRVDPISDVVIGFQIDAFLAETIYENTYFLNIAELAGIDAITLDRVREEMVRRRRALDEDERKRIALEEMFGPRLFQMAG